MDNIIQTVLIVLIITIMIGSTLIGLIQGFKKNMYYFIATIVFWIVFWLTAPWFTGSSLWNNESLYNSIKGILGTDATNYPTIMEYLKAIIAKSLSIDPELLSDPTVDQNITAILQSVLKIVYLILLSINYFILKVILYHTLFKRLLAAGNKKKLEKLKKEQEKYHKKHNEENPKLSKEISRLEEAHKKNKLYKPLGLASGFNRGLLSSFLILCVVNSTIAILPNLNSESEISANNDKTEQTKNLSLYEYMLSTNPDLAPALDIIKNYQQSNLSKVTKIKIGSQNIDDLFVDSIASGKSKDYSFALRKELTSIVQIAENAYYLTNGFDTDSVKWEALSDTQVAYLQKIINLLADDQLVTNLSSTLVGIAVSIDSVAKYMPENLSKAEYENINWSNELTSIATLVSKVYSLGDDLSKLDYLTLDTKLVEEIMIELSNIKSINLLGHIGTNLALKNYIKDDKDYGDAVNNISTKLATLATSNEFSNLFNDYSSLYTQFINIVDTETIDKYKDENGKVNNYMAAITSVDTNKYQTVVNTVFDANFVSEILPDFLTIVKKNIPEDYSSIINPDVLTSTQWKAEINTVLKIVGDITKDGNEIKPFESIKTYDFSLLRNFSTKTVIQSDLLSYAMIQSFIDASKNKGFLSKVSADLATYIKVPDALSVNYNSATHRFNAKWYGNKTNNYQDGELFIMLDTIKNCASKLENIDYPGGSFPTIVTSINPNDLLNSDVLYYSLDNVVKKYQDKIIVPVSETQTSLDTINGEVISNIIKKDEMKKMLDILVNPDVVDLESLLNYYKINEDGSISTEMTDNILIEDKSKYVAKIDFSQDKVLDLLTSDKLYNTKTKDETNINILFNSNIINATITNLLNNYSGDYITIPTNATNEEQACLVLKTDSNQIVQENINIVKKDQFKALIMSIKDLDVDMKSFTEEPIKIIDSLKDENGKLKEKEVNDLFGNGAGGTTSNKYSSIMHATLSKYIIDYSTEGSTSLELVVPDEAKDSMDNKIIKSADIVDLIRSISLIGSDTFTNKEATNEQLIDDIISKVIDNNDILDSNIMRATVTNYIDTTNDSVAVPSDSYESKYQTRKVISSKDLNDLVIALDSIKSVRNENELENNLPLSDFVNILDGTKLHANELNVANNSNKISNSKIICATITKDIQTAGIDIPNEVMVKDTSNNSLYINQEEINKFLNALPSITDENTNISNTNANSLTVGQIYNAKDNIKDSIIIKSLITKELNKQTDDLVVPYQALDTNITSINIITTEELVHFIDGINSLLNTEDKISSINAKTITTGRLYLAKESLKASYILNGTITKQLNEQNSITMPNVSYLDSIDKVLLNTIVDSETNRLDEISGIINCIHVLFGDDKTIEEINVDNLTIAKLNQYVQTIETSNILKATITSKINDQAVSKDGQPPILIVPSASKDVNGIIVDKEMNYLFSALDTLFGETLITEIKSFKGIDMTKLNSSIDNTSESLILRATISREIIELNFDSYSTLVVPNDCVEQVSEYQAIKIEEFKSLISALETMEIENIGEIYVDKLKVKKDCTDKLASSEIIRATITNKIKVDGNSLNYILQTDATILNRLSLGGSSIGILSINKEEFENVIDVVSSLNVDGSIKLSLNLATYATYDQSTKDKILSSNTFRIVISDLIIKATAYTGGSMLSSYQLSDSSSCEHRVMSKEEINNMTSI